MSGCNENSKKGDPAFERNHLLRRRCFYPRRAEDEARHTPKSPARTVVVADDLLDACCSGAKRWPVKSFSAWRRDAATTDPTIAAHIRVSIFCKRRDQGFPGNPPRQKALLRSHRAFRGAGSTASAARSA